MTYIAKISATGQFDLAAASPDQAFVAGVVITLYGFTGSLVLQKKPALGASAPNQIPSPSYFNVPYANQTGSSFTAGTAITADGMYVADATGAIVSLNVTSVGTNPFTVIVTPIEGAVGGGVGTSSGGGGGGNAYVPVVRYGDTALTQLTPAGDTAAHGIFGNVQGQILDGATAAGTAPIVVGGVDSTGNARSAPTNLSSATPISTANYGISVNAVMMGNSSANTLRALVTCSGFTAGGSGATTLINAMAAAVTSTTYEQVYNNRDVTWLTSAARTTLQTLADATNQNFNGVAIFVDVTAFTSNLTVTVNIKDPQSAKYFPIGSMTVTGTGSWLLMIHPGLGTGTGNNTFVSAAITRTFNATITGSATYTAGYSPIL
jgi:hypothetical protein